MNSRLLQEKAFGSIFIAKAGSVTQKDLFERCHFFYFYKLGEANPSWLTAAFCTVCAACILNRIGFISSSSVSNFTSALERGFFTLAN